MEQNSETLEQRHLKGIIALAKYTVTVILILFFISKQLQGIRDKESTELAHLEEVHELNIEIINLKSEIELGEINLKALNEVCESANIPVNDLILGLD